jgi:16S rRNA (cytosine967-C5)-methyltransferase
VLETQRLASQTVQQVFAGRNLNNALAAVWQAHPSLAANTRAAIQDISFGALRHYGELQSLLERLLAKPLADQPIRYLLLTALYQLRYSKAAPYAVVDHAVSTAQALGKASAKGLVNAVLRNYLRQSNSLLAAIQDDEFARYSYPRWWIDKVKQEYSEQWREILDAGNRHPPLTLRVNRRKTDLSAYLGQLERAGIAARTLGESAIQVLTPVSVDKLPGFESGLASVQDQSAQHAARLLDVADGMRVLDACAAPGGKTGHLLELADLDLLALDKDANRLNQVQANLTRLGLTAKLLAADAAVPDSWWDGVPFDRILLDAPCSASGVVKRHPDIKWLRRAGDIATYAQEQRRLLGALWRVLKRDGKLLYATCSVFSEENQAQITSFLTQYPDAARVPVSLAPSAQIVPDERADGFYYALLRKT